MLPCSVRRVAASAPQAPILATLPRATAVTITNSYTPAQRRRYSSSKPSRDNGSEDPVRQSVQPSSEAKTAEAKPAGEKRKRKAKDTSEKLKFPSVPTTAHIPNDFLALSSFFSLHRPISVTRGLPRNVSEDAFATIFNVPTRGQRTAEVMSTISRTVDDLEQPMAKLSLPQQHSHQSGIGKGSDSSDAHHHHDRGLQQKLDLANMDGSEASVTVQVNNMSGQFLPFRPPPLPRPQSHTAAAAAAAAEEATLAEEDAAQQQDAQTRIYKAVFTIQETTDANGEVSILAHSPEVLAEEDEDVAAASGDGGSGAATALARQYRATGRLPRTFLGRMALRQHLHDESMHAISVKRQRKLKMKKKKYKKLQKRLRHERLKHGRT